PLAGVPHGLTGCPPPEVLPSPPPIGWSTGFIATPLTLGRLPSHLDLPALPRLMFSCSRLLTTPIVALHSLSIILTSPDGSLICVYLTSLDTIIHELPA